MDENKLLERITVNPKIFGGKPIIRGAALLWSIFWECLRLGISRNDSEGIPLAGDGGHSGCLVYAAGW